MIGPHEGKELELMLAGQKKFAFFHDVIPITKKISEEIIPEKTFAPHVAQGKIFRFSEDIRDMKSEDVIRYVCFVLPGEEWRAQFFLWLARQRVLGLIPADDACDIMVGRLLGYSESDITEFLHKQKIRRAKNY